MASGPGLTEGRSSFMNLGFRTILIAMSSLFDAVKSVILSPQL